MSRALRSILASFTVAAIVTCGGAVGRAADPTGNDQAGEGATLYGKHCAKCHGEAGQGTKKAPPVVGKDALPLDPPAGAKVRKTQFRTAQDVAAFVAAKMPANKPGSLTVEQYYAILAFDLKANGVDVSTRTIDPRSAAEIKLH
jgi:cytochrome c